MLFNKRLLQTHLNSFDYPSNFNYKDAQRTVFLWQSSVKNGNYDKTKETQVQSKFLTKFFNEILGYKEMQDNPDEWQLDNEVKTEIDKTRADGALGYYTKEHTNDITRAVIELKDANTPLDKKQSSRKDYDSPVSQAFSYSSKFDRCDWIIVSNFKEIRLYNKDRGQGYYESFEILNLSNEKEFKRFYFCLCKQNLLDKNRNSLLDNLVKDTSKNEEEISKDFYKDFKALRKSLFEHICENNPDIDKKCLLGKTQKLLARLVFIMFCEDSAIGLLPPYTIRDYYNLRERIPSNSDEKVWTLFRDLFHSIDEGNTSVNPPINRYNGGLFAKDEILDNLKIKDSVWEEVVELSGYDFESDLNVNILGHIFEQSLNDLEQIKAEIDGIEQDNKKSKRKKDGIFYTPEYITRYIVEQTVGKYLEENPDKLESIKILDPACGSGAFLNQAHTFLQQQYKIRTEEKLNATRTFETLNLFEHQNIAENNRSILLNNLYGVDLNSESTEITKLALWLKTARKDQPLQNLDANIKCGNSLIDDLNIAGDKAFNWNEEFKDIMSNGGFDVIIGNPPYVFAREKVNVADKEYYNKNYDSSEYQVNTFVLFIEKAIKLLKNGGWLGFIIPNSLLQLSSISQLRKYILDNTGIKEIINLCGYSFEGVGVETVILILKKGDRTNNVNVLNLYEEKDLSSKSCRNVIAHDWNCNQNYEFNIFLSEKEELLLEKITNNSYELERDYEVKAGLKAYEKGKGNPKQTEEDVKNRIYDYNYKMDDTTYPYLEGKDINRYINFNHSSWLKYGANLAAPRTFNIFSSPRILIREITDKHPKSVLATFINEIYLNNLSIINILSKNNNKIDLLYLLSILNSSLISFYFGKTTPKANRTMFPKIILQDLRKFPVFNANDIQKQNLAQKAEQMIELNKQLHEGIDSALELIKSVYQPKQISQNLEKFYTLGKYPFLEELEKQKVKLSLNQKEELIKWYQDKSKVLNNIQKQIDILDQQIDQEVYKLYNLTDEEIKIIEKS